MKTELFLLRMVIFIQFLLAPKNFSLHKYNKKVQICLTILNQETDACHYNQKKIKANNFTNNTMCKKLGGYRDL